MKKIIAITLISVLTVTTSFAQIQRTPKAKMDSAVTQEAAAPKTGRGQMIKSLNLTRQQKLKMKEIMQDSKAKKQAIDSDTTLVGAAKQQKMRALRKEQFEKINSMLTDEQKEKFKQLRSENKGMKKDEEEEMVP